MAEKTSNLKNLPTDNPSYSFPLAHIWSVITTVPSGHRQFCYLVDGTPVISPKHPTNPQGSLNWRKVRGPPARPRPPIQQTLHNLSPTHLSTSIRQAATSLFHSDPISINKRYRSRRRQQSHDSHPDVETNSPPAPVATSRFWPP
eukprot:GFKZ01010961.1.p1 GENE.GFKZ01010961.1~~GFKZ01010961.1.p1  ORF type:complete len:145 (+),score=7.74 GFKZ01010961.1:528-962(+)